MKLINKLIGCAAVMAFLSVAANLQAQITNVITFTATASVQGTANDNGTVTTATAPTKVSLTTKQLLTYMALAEKYESNYVSTVFPVGAKLVVIVGAETNDFQVVDKTNKFLVDVSDIFSGTAAGVFQSDIYSGKQNDTNNVALPTTTDLQIFALFYDDTFAGGTLQFNLLGLMTNAKTDTVPVKATGAYTRTTSHKMPASAGDGNYHGTPLVITGSFTATGTAKMNINQ